MLEFDYKIMIASSLITHYLPIAEEKTSKDLSNRMEVFRKSFALKPVFSWPSNPVAPRTLSGTKLSSSPSKGWKKEF